MERSIDDILSDEPIVAPEAEAESDPIVSEPSLEGLSEPRLTDPDRPRGPDGKFVKKEETGVEPTAQAAAEPVPPTDRLPQAEYAALKDERRKRQEIEAQLEQALGLLNQHQSLKQQEPQQVPDMFDDPDGFKAHLAEQIRAELMQELTPTLNQHRTLTRAEMSEIAARQKYEDYDDTVEVFKEAMATNPFLLTQLQQAADPAVFAYNAGKQFQAAKAYGSEAPPSREQLKAELLEEIKAELNLNRPTAPSTLADGRSVGSRSGPSWSGPRPLSDILG